MVTSVGFSGEISGWIIPKALHNISFAIGTLVRKPWVVKEKIEIRTIMNLTVQFDHDVIDGVPAAQFVKKLVRTIESGRIPQ